MERTWRGVVFIATSTDGYIARRDGDIRWLTDPDPKVNHPGEAPGLGYPGNYDELMKRVDHLVMGRGTYEKVVTFDAWPYAIPVLVLSATLPPGQDERIKVVRSVEDAVETLNHLGARGVYVDGGQVIQSFLRADLIDEMTLTRAPVLIGSGFPLFGELAEDVQLALQDVSASGGYIHARYDVVR